MSSIPEGEARVHVRSSADEQLIDQARALNAKVHRDDDLASVGMMVATDGWFAPPETNYWYVRATVTPKTAGVAPYTKAMAYTQNPHVAGLLCFMSTALPRLCDLADQALASPPQPNPSPSPGGVERVPDDVARLVVAARIVAFEDQGPDALRELQEASEAFADRVRWDDEPDDGACESEDPQERCAACDCWKLTREICS